MDDAKSSYAVTQNHQSTAQEPQKLAIPSEQIKNTTEGKSIGQTASKPPYKPFTHLYCCLPKGETYTGPAIQQKSPEPRISRSFMGRSKPDGMG